MTISIKLYNSGETFDCDLSRQAIADEAYYIAKGVRPMSMETLHVKGRNPAGLEELRVTLAEHEKQYKVYSFLTLRESCLEPGTYYVNYGFAVTEHIISLYRYVDDTKDLSRNIYESAMGLLLGYSPLSTKRMLNGENI